MPDQITTPEALAAFLADARTAPSVAVDTEAASFHRYRDRIYLVQISTGSRTAVVDPLAATDLAALGAFLADPSVEKIFHDAGYDLRILDRDYGFRARRVFDTRIAAQLAGEPAIGLAALLERYAGVTPAKVHEGGLILHVREALEKQAREEGRTAEAVWTEAIEGGGPAE